MSGQEQNQPDVTEAAVAAMLQQNREVILASQYAAIVDVGIFYYYTILQKAFTGDQMIKDLERVLQTTLSQEHKKQVRKYLHMYLGTSHYTKTQDKTAMARHGLLSYQSAHYVIGEAAGEILERLIPPILAGRKKARTSTRGEALVCDVAPLSDENWTASASTLFNLMEKL